MIPMVIMTHMKTGVKNTTKAGMVIMTMRNMVLKKSTGMTQKRRYMEVMDRRRMVVPTTSKHGLTKDITKEGRAKDITREAMAKDIIKEGVAKVIIKGGVAKVMITWTRDMERQVLNTMKEATVNMNKKASIGKVRKSSRITRKL